MCITVAHHSCSHKHPKPCTYVLQGFVSNKDSEEEGKGDPLEALLYAVFVATSERASVAELAGILSVEVPKLQMAISIACRLGFGTRLTPAHQGELQLTAVLVICLQVCHDALALVPWQIVVIQSDPSPLQRNGGAMVCILPPASTGTVAVEHAQFT